MPTVTLDINSSQITMSVANENGGKQIKIIDPDDFALAMAKQCRVETGLLPSSARYFASNGQLTSVILEVKAHVRRITVLDRMIDVPLPTCLMMLTTNTEAGGKHISGSYFYCHRDPLLSPKTQLMKFPFGNVFADGRICWGNVTLPKITETYQLGAIPDHFLNTNFNGHLDNPIFQPFSKQANGTTITINRGVQLAQHLATEKITQFPNDILMPMGTTFADLIKTR